MLGTPMNGSLWVGLIGCRRMLFVRQNERGLPLNASNEIRTTSFGCLRQVIETTLWGYKNIHRGARRMWIRSPIRLSSAGWAFRNDNGFDEREREKETRNINSLIGTPPFESEEVFSGFSKPGAVVLLLLLLNAEEMFWIGLDILFPMPRIRSLFRSAIRGIEIA